MVFFFFFQAEDGIRDLTVTGVQTCALPIYVYASGEYEPVVSWAAEPVAAEVRATGEAVEVTCPALGLEKRLRFAARGGVTVTHRWGAAPPPATAGFAPQVPLPHPPQPLCRPEADGWYVS